MHILHVIYRWYISTAYQLTLSELSDFSIQQISMKYPDCFGDKYISEWSSLEYYPFRQYANMTSNESSLS